MELCQSFLCRCLHNKIFTEFFDYVQFSLFFLPPHTLKFNLLKVDFCLNTFGNQSLCKPRSQAVLYTRRCFFIFLSILTVRDAASFTASRPQAVFAFSSRLQRHTSRCSNQVSSHCQVLQCTGYTTRTVAVLSASRASDPNAFTLRYTQISGEIWDEARFTTSADEDESVTHATRPHAWRRQTLCSDVSRWDEQTEPWLRKTKTQTFDNWRQSNHQKVQLEFLFPLWLPLRSFSPSRCLSFTPPTPLPLLTLLLSPSRPSLH